MYATIVLIYRNARLTCTCISATEYIGTAQSNRFVDQHPMQDQNFVDNNCN